MKCDTCGTDMQRTGEHLGMAEFYVCLKCHPEYTKQVENYAIFNRKLWEKFTNSR
jgi:ribosome-binding protein aMBF1 (putative translation factor)